MESFYRFIADVVQVVRRFITFVSASSGFREQIQIDFETFLLPSRLPNLVSTLDIFLTLISKHLFLFGKQFFSPPKKRSFIDGMKTSSVFRLESGAPQR